MSHRYDLLHQGRTVCVLLGGSGTISVCKEPACPSMIHQGLALQEGMRLNLAKARLLSEWPQMPHTCRLQCPARSKLFGYARLLASLSHLVAYKLQQWALHSHPLVFLALREGG